MRKSSAILFKNIEKTAYFGGNGGKENEGAEAKRRGHISLKHRRYSVANTI